MWHIMRPRALRLWVFFLLCLPLTALLLSNMKCHASWTVNQVVTCDLLTIFCLCRWRHFSYQESVRKSKSALNVGDEGLTPEHVGFIRTDLDLQMQSSACALVSSVTIWLKLTYLNPDLHYCVLVHYPNWKLVIAISSCEVWKQILLLILWGPIMCHICKVAIVTLNTHSNKAQLSLYWSSGAEL